MRRHSMAAVLFLCVVSLASGGRKKKWLKHPSIVVLKTQTGEVREIPTQDTELKKNGHRNHHRAHVKFHQRRLNFQKTDAIPYSSPLSRPYNWNMYTDGPYGWGPARRKRSDSSHHLFKRDLYPRNYVQQYNSQLRPKGTPSYQPAQPSAFYQSAQLPSYGQPAPQTYSYQAAESRNTLAQSSPIYARQPLAEGLQKKAPQSQQPQERTWVDKMGVKWTTRKVNDYKWGEREPGITMDEYAGGPFGFDDVKRTKIQRTQAAQWQKRANIPRPSSNIQRRRSWIDKYGVRWTNKKVNDYKWGEREPGVTMDEYNGGPYGWNDVKRNEIPISFSRNMYYMDKP